MLKKLLISFLFLFPCILCGQTRYSDFPNPNWQEYLEVTEAGFSSDKLAKVESKFTQSKAAGFFLVHRGRIVADWGETNRKFRCASVRKSFMNAAFGIASKRKPLVLNKTLEALDIDDLGKLTHTEKQATIRHLLSAKSGVYHPAAYSPRNMAKHLPQRGSHSPGSFWYYNNWDFNTLSTILKKEAGEDVFQIFARDIARPLNMEDFGPEDTYFRYEKDKSIHPAYLFRMTARDMARFGLLYLNKGSWRGQELVPSDWIEKSTSHQTSLEGNFAQRGSYGYLWWVSNGIRNQKMYFASGSGGQRICVFPELELVAVHVVNTYEEGGVTQEEIDGLLELVVDAFIGKPKRSPKLKPYVSQQRPLPEAITITPESLQQFTGSFRHRFLGEFHFSSSESGLVMECGIGKFVLRTLAKNVFWAPDLETELVFKPAPNAEKKSRLEFIAGEKNNDSKVIAYY